MTVLFVLPLLTQHSLELYRGCALPGDPGTRYYACEDTTLDRAKPNGSFGNAAVISISPAERSLIRFGDLRRAIGFDKKILSAELTFTVVQASKPGRVTLHRMSKPWTEGPGSGNDTAAPDPFSTTWSFQIFKKKGEAVKWSGGEDSFDPQPTCTADLAAGTETFKLTGLERDVQRMLDHPESNFGWMIRFDGSAVLDSSESISGRPTLHVQFEESPRPQGADLCAASAQMNGGSSLVVNVKNVGTTRSGAYDVAVFSDGSPIFRASESNGLVPGESRATQFAFTRRAPTNDHRWERLVCEVVPKASDARSWNDALPYYVGGRECRITASPESAAECENAGLSVEEYAQIQFETWNETFLAHSRFSIARDGSHERVNLCNQGTSYMLSSPIVIGAANRAMIASLTAQFGGFRSETFNGVLNSDANDRFDAVRFPRGSDPYAGVMGFGDTRNEMLIPGQLSLPSAATDDPTFQSGLFTPTDLYSLTDVARIDSLIGAAAPPQPTFPPLVLVRPIDANGVSIPEAKLTFFSVQNGAVDAAASFELPYTGGSALIPNKQSGPFGAPSSPNVLGLYVVRLDFAGASAFAFLNEWRVLDAASREGKRAVVLDLVFNAVHTALKPGNFALKKIAIDSANTTPSELGRLLDGDRSTTYSGNPEWIELDLGRDRPIGEIRIYADSIWNQFDIIAYSTGQTVADAQLFAHELDSSMRERHCFESDLKDWCLAYRARPLTVRFIRIVRKGAGTTMIREIEVREAEPIK
jgi:hypothetical protein